MHAHLPLRALAPVIALALACVPSAGAGRATYPPVYHLVAHLTAVSGAQDATATFVGTLAIRGTHATLRWKLTSPVPAGVSVTTSLRARRSSTVKSAAVRLCPPPGCRSGMQETTSGAFDNGSPLLAGLLHDRDYVELRTSGPAGELRGKVMVATAAVA